MTLRTRTRGELSLFGTTSESNLYNSCNTSWVVDFTSGNCYVGDRSTMTDVVVPRFNARRNKGEIFFNPMSSRKESYSITGGNGIHVRRLETHSCSGIPRSAEFKFDSNEIVRVVTNLATRISPNYIPVARLINDSDMSSAITEVATKVSSGRGRSDSNLSEDIAEFDKSLGMLSSINHDIKNALTRVPSKMIGSAANIYLLARYGLKPLFGSASSIVQSFGQITERVRRTTRSQIVLNDTQNSSLIQTGTYADRNVLSVDKHTIVLRGVSLDEFITSAAYEAGFHLKGLLTLPWELVPYSFVVDWFANVGDFIGALTPTPNFNQLGSCLTVRSIRESSYTLVGATVHPGGGYNYELLEPPSGSAHGRIETFSRVALPNPGLVIKNDFRLSNITRALDSVALVSQQLLRIMKPIR